MGNCCESRYDDIRKNRNSSNQAIDSHYQMVLSRHPQGDSSDSLSGHEAQFQTKELVEYTQIQFSHLISHFKELSETNKESRLRKLIKDLKYEEISPGRLLNSPNLSVLCTLASDSEEHMKYLSSKLAKYLLFKPKYAGKLCFFHSCALPLALCESIGTCLTVKYLKTHLSALLMMLGNTDEVALKKCKRVLLEHNILHKITMLELVRFI